MADDQPGKPQPEVSFPTQEEPPLSMRRVASYLYTRIPTLMPPMNPAPNPIKAVLLLNTEQWLFFLVCFPYRH